VDSGGPKEAQAQSYSPAGGNVPSREGTLAHPANAIEPSVCGGDAALCEITLTVSFSCSQSYATTDGEIKVFNSSGARGSSELVARWRHDASAAAGPV